MNMGGNQASLSKHCSFRNPGEMTSGGFLAVVGGRKHFRRPFKFTEQIFKLLLSRQSQSLCSSLLLFFCLMKAWTLRGFLLYVLIQTVQILECNIIILVLAHTAMHSAFNLIFTNWDACRPGRNTFRLMCAGQTCQDSHREQTGQQQGLLKGLH